MGYRSCSPPRGMSSLYLFCSAGSLSTSKGTQGEQAPRFTHGVGEQDIDLGDEAGQVVLGPSVDSPSKTRPSVSETLAIGIETEARDKIPLVSLCKSEASVSETLVLGIETETRDKIPLASVSETETSVSEASSRARAESVIFSV